MLSKEEVFQCINTYGKICDVAYDLLERYNKNIEFQCDLGDIDDVSFDTEDNCLFFSGLANYREYVCCSIPLKLLYDENAKEDLLKEKQEKEKALKIKREKQEQEDKANKKRSEVNKLKKLAEKHGYSINKK